MTAQVAAKATFDAACDAYDAALDALVAAAPDGAEVTAHDPVSHPSHYTTHPSGVECITITRHMGFNLGNALKYIWRADLKSNAVQDLEKAVFYLTDEIAMRKADRTRHDQS